jgi:hypothetical protein
VVVVLSYSDRHLNNIGRVRPDPCVKLCHSRFAELYGFECILEFICFHVDFLI